METLLVVHVLDELADVRLGLGKGLVLPRIVAPLGGRLEALSLWHCRMDCQL